MTPALRWREAIVILGGALLFSAAAALSGWSALKNHQARQLYEEKAVVTLGRVTGFETLKITSRRGQVVRTLPTVEFNVDGRMLRTRLLAARPVFPHQREAWIGRSIELRYPPGSPGQVIASDAIDELPGMSPKVLTGIAAVLLAMAALMLGAWWSLGRSRSKAGPARDRVG